MRNMIKALVAGYLIAIANMAFYAADNKFIGSLLFSIGLLCIIELRLPLYTGACGFRKYPAKELAVMLLMNLIGVLITIHYTSEDIKELALQRLDRLNWIDAVVLSILCGILIYIAAYCRNKYITTFCVTVFVFCGFKHCIAEFPYVVASGSIKYYAYWVLMIAGNYSGAVMMNDILSEK